MRVVLIAKTEFLPSAAISAMDGFTTDADGGEALAEAAGRACYQSFSKPNTSTATNAGYLEHILEVGHLSVLEHGSASFYITGVSRSLTHELVRHRHFSFSQLSQRYVAEGDTDFIEPGVIAADPDLHQLYIEAVENARASYTALAAGLRAKLSDVSDSTSRRKQARQAARSVLPNATETRIVVTGNYRAWRHFISMRATEAADVEIRELALTCLGQLREVAPTVFGDFSISLIDGVMVAATANKWG